MLQSRTSIVQDQTYFIISESFIAIFAILDLRGQIAQWFFTANIIAFLFRTIVFIFVQVAFVNGVDVGRMLLFSGS
jgi:hypothetical protein